MWVFVFKDHNRWALWLAKNLNSSSASQLFQLGKGPSRASRGTVQLREGSLTAQHQPALHSSSLQQHPFGNISQITAIIDTGFLLNIVSMGPSSVHILHPTFYTHSHTHIAHEWWIVVCIKHNFCHHFGQKVLMKKVWSLSKSSAQHSSSSAAFTNPPSNLHQPLLAVICEQIHFSSHKMFGKINSMPRFSIWRAYWRFMLHFSHCFVFVQGFMSIQSPRQTITRVSFVTKHHNYIFTPP